MKTTLPITCAVCVVLTGACHTNTAIGIDPTGQGGSPNMLNTAGAAGTSGAGLSSGAAGQTARSAPTCLASPDAVEGPQGPYVPSAPLITAGDQPFTNPAGVAGVWTGYLENLQFPSGSDAVSLTFAEDATGAGTLTVVLGSAAALPPPPTDPGQVWPVPTEDTTTLKNYPRIAEGFAYPAHEVVWEGSRVKFKVASAQAWTVWCGLQTSYPSNNYPPGQYSCVPGGSGAFSWGPDAGGGPATCFGEDCKSLTDIPVTCGQLALCVSGGRCACNTTGCGPSPLHDLSFDLTFAGASATGSGTGLATGATNVHLTQAAN
jgi:hypothetical protein